MRSRPGIRTRYRFDPPPKDGSEIVVPVTLPLTVFWSKDLERWVLTRPLQMETIGEFVRWRKPGLAPPRASTPPR
jgi:hypothetical protein